MGFSGLKAFGRASVDLAIDVRNEAASFANMGFNRYDGIPAHVSQKKIANMGFSKPM